jgi:hypothetical protein
MKRIGLTCVCGTALLLGSAASAQVTGPSSSASPYLTPVAPGAMAVSILTAGDGVTHADGLQNGTADDTYNMVGIPDGLGALDNGDGTFTLFMNHEIGRNQGIVRDHGSIGSFVSEWVIDSNSLQVVSGDDQIKERLVWDEVAAAYKTATPVTSTLGPFDPDSGAADRYCSADLPEVTAFFNPLTGLGTEERIFMNGEETRPPFSDYAGRAFAHVVTGPDDGTSYELPRLGNYAWENSIASPYAQDKTVVMGMDDSDRATGLGIQSSELYMYVGTKTDTGTVIDKAGLTNGNLYGLQITGLTGAAAGENQLNGFASGSYTPSARFAFYNHGDVSADPDGAALQAADNANDVFRFQRLEDGVWDPADPNVFWFLTTDQYDAAADGTGAAVGRSRLFRMTYDDITDPTAGGTIDIVLDGVTATPQPNGEQTFGPQMMDNLTAVLGPDGVTRLVIQEDPGGVAASANIWVFNPNTNDLDLVFEHDEARFGDREFGVNTPATAPFNTNEESSGIIPAFDLLGEGWFLADVQAHYAIGGGEIVEGGQLLALYIPQAIPEPGTLLLLGSGIAGLGIHGRRRA